MRSSEAAETPQGSRPRPIGFAAQRGRLIINTSQWPMLSEGLHSAMLPKTEANHCLQSRSIDRGKSNQRSWMLYECRNSESHSASRITDFCASICSIKIWVANLGIFTEQPKFQGALTTSVGVKNRKGNCPLPRRRDDSWSILRDSASTMTNPQ